MVMDAATIRVVVCEADGRVYPGDARVELVDDGGHTVVLDRTEDGLFYAGAAAAGPYSVRASADGLIAPARGVEVGREPTACVYLGEEGWPTYRLGRDVFPYAPPDRLLAVAFPDRVPPEEEGLSVGQDLIDVLGLRPLQVEDRPTLPSGLPDFRNADEAIWLFVLPDGADQAELLRAAKEILLARVGDRARVGVPVDLIPGQLKVIDSRVVLRFQDSIAPDRIKEVLADAEADVIARLSRFEHLVHVVELPDTPQQALDHVESWRDLLVYGEPDVMAQIVDDVFPATSPLDPLFVQQTNLLLHAVDAAWRTLDAAAAGGALGSPGITVCTLDCGVDLGHPDIGGNLTDGAPQIVRAYDFSVMRDLPDPAYQPTTSHGLNVLAMIAARTDNGIGIAGIAPNTHQIYLEHPPLKSVTYAEVLHWVGGFTSVQPPANWPQPLKHGADVICCSHGSDGLGLSTTMKDTFDELATLGRGGKGTVVVYSAGNGHKLITSSRRHAAYATNLAVANSLAPDSHGVERRDPDSNFGHEIDVCAQGTGSTSLGPGGGTEQFDGTSAAAPIVAGVAALMLSHQPALTLAQVRSRLTASAVRIDTANNDPVGRWVDNFSQWYGSGRVDAGQAVV